MPPINYHYGKFPPASLDWQALVPLIGPATLAIGDFKGLLAAVPNPAVLLSPITTQEAVLSSKIEGTIATLGEVLEYEAGASHSASPEKIGDIQEILNYRKAIHHAASRLNDLPLCGRIIKEAHAILMDGVRGKNKAPGEFKRVQTAIGFLGGGVETARFLPILPEKLEGGISEWEKYINSDQPDILVQLAILHAEFESLHPFADGNGRLGRMLIPLFLYSKKFLNVPAFYLSEYLESNRDEYYDRLLAVSQNDDWTGWCSFFLRALEWQARKNTQKARSILDLYEKRKPWIIDITHSQYAMQALDFLFTQPIFKGDSFSKQPGIPDATARAILRQIRDEILVELSPASGRKAAVYAYAELINLAEGRKIF